MKKFWKNNYLIIISIILLVGWFSSAVYSQWKVYDNNAKSYHKHYYLPCKEGTFRHPKSCPEILKTPYGDGLPDSLTFYGSLYTDQFILIQLLGIFFIIVPSVWFFHKQTKSGMFKNNLTREKYSSFFKRNYFKSLKTIIIFPVFVIVSFFIVCCVTGFNFNYQQTVNDYGPYLTSEYYRSLFIPFLITFIVCLVLHSIYYVNTAYMAAYKSKNYIITIVYTFLIYLFTQIMISTVIGYICSKFLKMGNIINAFTDTTIWTYGEVERLSDMIIISIVYVLISSAIVFFLYRKKERFVIANEE